MLYFWNDLTAMANEGKEISVIYTDLRKVFDTVPHDLLLYKLEKNGVCGKNLEWLKDFLHNRHQKVRIGNALSSKIPIASGVPQGGVLSGLLFILYMNDMPRRFQYVKTSMYADDAKLYAAIEGETSVLQVQSDLERLSVWCRTWRMRLNAQKCFHLHYVPQNKQKTHPQYQIDGEVLSRRSSALDLGIIVEDTLKFHAQVAKACKKATTLINTIRRTFVSRNPRFLENMYKTFIRPHLEYCVQVWSPVYAGDTTAIEKVQNRFTRLLPQSSAMAHDERNKLLNITSHEVRRLRGDLIYTYKMYESGLFEPSTETRTRGNSRKLKKEHCRNNLRQHSFAARSVDAWNHLPDCIVTADTLDTFKARLDLYLNSV